MYWALRRTRAWYIGGVETVGQEVGRLLERASSTSRAKQCLIAPQPVDRLPPLLARELGDI